MYDLSSSPSTTVNSTLKTLTSRFEYLVNNRNDEEMPASWSGMWGTRQRPLQSRRPIMAGLHVEFTAGRSALLQSLLLLHGHSSTRSPCLLVLIRNIQHLLCGGRRRRLPETYHPVQFRPQMAHHYRRVRHLRDCHY